VIKKHLEDIIKGCKKGERRSQEMLYQHYSGKMYAVCLYYAGNKTEAEDFLHNGFIKVFKYIKQYKKKGVFDAWMRKIFMHTALEKYRVKKQLFISFAKEDVQMLESNQEDALSQISAADLTSLIQQLSPVYRMVFNLYAIEGYSHKEVGTLLGISEGTSKSNLSRARVLLQKQVKERFELNTSIK
jgi:RNA polymerase sigma-70 factor (ECF subfamily)